jgi:hypothetical protein
MTFLTPTQILDDYLLSDWWPACLLMILLAITISSLPAIFIMRRRGKYSSNGTLQAFVFDLLMGASSLSAAIFLFEAYMTLTGSWSKISLSDLANGVVYGAFFGVFGCSLWRFVDRRKS